MKILIVTQHFPPERGAVRLIFEFARLFVKQGHDVSVMTATPNYPDGIVPPEYKGKFFNFEVIDGVKVYRSWVLPASNSQPKKRMIGFITFLCTTLINSFKVKGDFDMVIASSPPITTPLTGWLLSKLKKCTFVLEIRDLQPESSEDFGNLKRSFFTRMLKKYMSYMYKKADRIIGVTQGISDFLHKTVENPEKIHTIKSGVSSEFINSGSNGIRKKFGWEEKYLVIYSGTFGWAHSFETFIEAARQLNDQPDILFAFVGEGQKKQVLEGMVRDYNLKNVEFVGIQPLESIPYFLQAGDVLVECLKDVPITKGSLPSKLFEYMASGKPILYGSSDGEAVDELEKAGGALSFHSEDINRLSELILELKNGTIDGNQLGEKYSNHVKKNHSREMWADKYLTILEKTA